MNRNKKYLSMLRIKLFSNISLLIHDDDSKGLSELTDGERSYRKIKIADLIPPLSDA